MKQKLTYESALAKLESIVSSIERGDQPIDQLTVHIKRAQELLAFCKSQLLQVETDINTLLSDNAHTLS